MSSPTPFDQRPAWQVAFRKIGAAVVSLLALLGAVMIVNGFVGRHSDARPQAVPTVTVTATPSAEAAAAPVETTPPAPGSSTEPTEDPAQAVAPVPVYTPGPAAPPVPAQIPTVQAAATDLVSSQGMQGDDYVIYMSHDVTLAQAQAIAPDLLAAKLAELRGTPQAKNIDLVAVYGPDHELLTTDQVTPHPQCAGC